MSTTTVQDVSHKVRLALRDACVARSLPFDPGSLAGACAVASAALMMALAIADTPAEWVHGRMLRPATLEDHTWVLAGGVYVDLTATQAVTATPYGRAPAMVDPVRIVSATSRCYKQTVQGGPSFGPCLDVDPTMTRATVSPWHHESALVDVVSAAMGVPRDAVEPHAMAVLWGDESRRWVHATPAIVLAELASLPGLTLEDARELTAHARALLAGRKNVAKSA